MNEIKRSYYNNDLSLANVGEHVYLIGWVSNVRNFGSIAFIDLRDTTGIVQLLADNEKYSFPKLGKEYLIHVSGVVSKKEVPNKNLKTGDVEVVLDSIEIINEAEQTPMLIKDDTDALEDLRLKYRYLDLRRPIMQERLKLRAKIVRAVHEYLDSKNFYEIETPILTLSTPEGARDYLVPSRVNKGQFYALPQSPQLFKQLLMVAGFERYYQVARCFRDEDLRADRQPDFTQIDIEASFLNQEQILEMMEELLQKIFKETINYDVKLPLRRMKYDDAVNSYGSDKPDTRFDLKLHDVTSVLKNTEFGVFQNSKFIKGIKIDGVSATFTRKFQDKLNLTAKKFNMNNYFFIKFENGTVNSSILKFLNEEIIEELKKIFEVGADSVICLAASNIKRDVNFGLGALRTELAEEFNLINKDEFDLLWVVDWPLFAYDEVNKTVSPEHHPFTRPKDENLDILMTRPQDVYAYCYDIVINGYEAGGGSLRIYDGKIQNQIFELLGFTEADIQRKFGWFIDAFRYGTPPHAGIAFGLERLTMVLSKTDNIRDVIAFPKNLKARCPMTNAPQEVSDDQLVDLSIKVIKE